ncbi:hypothetical protein ACH4ZX_39670 [Streptomyces sp. NPDC020490]|uniref:hypothetical protein n=1 Tax=Streptomyces sp. NPDC020490 TaxID=3365078 RepID=UPI00379DF8A2
MTSLDTAMTADFEGWLVDQLRRDVQMRGELPGFRHAGGVAGLLLTYGRLFTPAPWPDGGDPPGDPGRCYTESVSWAWASEGELVYVEGMAWDLAFPMEHAWCGTADGTARDLTWRRPGRAYLGIPVHAEEATRIMGAQGSPLLYSAEGHASRLAIEWARDGIPAELLADVGRPVPADA